jgi:hypothetical protein
MDYFGKMRSKHFVKTLFNRYHDMNFKKENSEELALPVYASKYPRFAERKRNRNINDK